ncbi:hypothetical protein PG985_015963 [Apiospora marii]|uniref:uncharacterized protein n=1 Tax=Apiospora marii TaxID=335849 RepID=UPI00312CE2E1
MNDLFNGKDCFLAHPQWQPVMRHHGENPSDWTVDSHIYKYQVDLVDDYMQLLARIPSAVKHLYMLRAANAAAAKTALGMAEVARIRQSMLDIRAAFAAWYQQRLLPANPAPEEVPTQDPESIYATVLRYESPWKGALHMGYWASLCIVHATLMECRQASPSPNNINNECANDGDDDESYYGKDTAAATFEPLADRILRSVETVGEGLMGPYRCGYSIRIAYEVVDERAQAWVRMWVARFERRYAATAVESYPSSGEVFLAPSSSSTSTR